MSVYHHPGVSRRTGDAPIELATLASGFSDPVHDSQRVFRVLLDALSHPGKIVSVASAVPGFDASTAFAGASVPLAAYAALLTLADYVTPVWQPELRVLGDALRFHTGAPLVADARRSFGHCECS